MSVEHLPPTRLLMQPGEYITEVSLLEWVLVLRARAEPWRAQAACRGRTDIDFFPRRGEHEKVRAAKAVCAACPVRVECLEFAMHDEEAQLVGVWGGTSARERSRLHEGRERCSTEGACRADECGHQVKALGLCTLHYGRLRRYGTLELPEGVNSRGWEKRRRASQV